MMAIVFRDYPLRAVDISQYNGRVDFKKLADTGAQICIMRSGYGVVTDSRFKENWVACKGIMGRVAYHYMDYYSNHTPGSGVNGLSNKEWGKRQAEATWALLKDDNDGAVVFLDIEKASHAVDITVVSDRVQEIARAYLERLDELSGKKNGVYCSVSKLTWFGSWFKDRPLWVAWYSVKTPEQVWSSVLATGWKDLLMWQYSSYGDVDGNGSQDGYFYGTQLSSLDLNIWMATEKKFDNFVKIPEMIPGLYEMECLVGSLRVRVGPGKEFGQIDYAIKGKKYPVYEESGLWVRIGPGRWVCTRDNGDIYMKRVGGVVEVPGPVEPSDSEKLGILWSWYLKEGVAE